MTVRENSVERGIGLSRQVHSVLLDRIAQGKMGPEARLVVERIAAELGVSPTPVREAIQRLIQDGLVEDGPNGRLHVVRLTPDYVINTFMVRAVLEGLAAELAAASVDPPRLSDLRQALSQMGPVVQRGDYEGFWTLDGSLHRMVQEAADNPVLSRELRPLQNHIVLIYAYVNRESLRQRLAEHAKRSHAEHVRLVEALASHKPRLARREVEKHVRDAGKRYAALIESGRQSADMGRDAQGHDRRE
jgi:DNA-binding GntR family transcriptional regulator